MAAGIIIASLNEWACHSALFSSPKKLGDSLPSSSKNAWV